ncbi:LysR family transcriptional regulator [Exilibacterium tricleocarpae]|uniref:LysR family transcriptional regulator n=1 Tax=Exilibacterium tricleocarpae TaxID=2591008 RepID=A0A545T0D0_9GAMM|nr:LysR substrate-binding domain-containing protein [Exilibacterium tricleocarpae]TQV70676.1 LysR family transcriptional regulator [Exilibacterium tricleocarpae]
MLLPRRQLPLNALRAFETAARHSNLRSAARELGVTHGAVSRQVRQLEGRLGVTLFERSHNRLSLTSAGQRLMQTVGEAFDQIARSTLYLDPDSMAGSLVIGSTPSITLGWLLRVIGEFHGKYPEVQLELRNITPEEKNLPAALDVAICYGLPEAGPRAVSVLFTEQYFPVCSPALISSGEPLRRPQDLLKYPLLDDQHNHWTRWFEHLGASTPNPVKRLFVQESYQVISAVREGYGVGLVDRIEVARDLRQGNLVALFEDRVAAPHSHYLVHDPEPQLTLRARVFVEFLHQSLQVLLA